ncbi:MAG TPA: hypothetical protein VHV77_06455 [Pirellulales bacterium]|nr:hypothetical protein [Pirellulales bacterium]
MIAIDGDEGESDPTTASSMPRAFICWSMSTFSSKSNVTDPALGAFGVEAASSTARFGGPLTRGFAPFLPLQLAIAASYSAVEI